MKRNRLRAIAFVVVIAVAAFYAVKNARQPSAVEYKAPTQEQCQAFALELERTISEGDSSFMNANVHTDLLVDRMLLGRGVAPATLRKFRKGIEKSSPLGANVANKITAVTLAGGRYDLLRVHSADDEMRALFRLLPPGGGVNYHDFVLALKDEAVNIADVYVYTSGEFMSASIRKLVLPVFVRGDESLLKRLPEEDSSFVRNLDDVEAFRGAVGAGDFDEVLAVYDRLPAELKKNKNLMIHRVAAEGEKDPESEGYKRAIADLEAAFPGDPCLDLILVDHHVSVKDYSKAHLCIASLRQSMGGGPYLDVLDGGVFLTEGRYDGAIESYEKAIAADNTLTKPYWGLVTVALKRKDWPAVSAGLTRIETELGIEIADLQGIGSYAEYVKTEEYEKWKASH